MKCRWLVLEDHCWISCKNEALFDMVGVEESIGECCARCKERMEKKMPKVIFERLL